MALLYESDAPPVVRTIDLSAEAKKAWGKEWNAPQLEYRFGNKREFKRRVDDCAIYATSPDHG